MKGILFAILLFFLSCFSYGSKSVTSLFSHKINHANEEVEVTPQLVFNDYNDKEYTKNNSYSLEILSKSVTKISSLSFDIFYEKDVVNVYNSYNYLTIDSSSMFDDKIDNENGVIHVSYIFAENKKLDDGRLFELGFNILSTTKTNSYFSLAITSSLDQDTNQINMKGDFDYFSIKNNQNTNNEIYIYSNVDKETFKRNELVDISYSCDNAEYLGAGTFEFTYDREAFEFVYFGELDFLSDSSMYSTVNTSIEGSIKISFACADTHKKYTWRLFFIQLKVKANVDKDWNLKLEASGLTSKDGNTKYTAPVVENKITTVYEQDKSLLPLMYLTSKKDEENKKLYITLSLEESSHLSAADIVITFDNNILSYQSYKSLVTTLENPMLGVNSNDAAKNGTIKVGWVYLKDLTQKVDFAQFTFDILDVVVDTTTSISLNATGTRDFNLKEVDLAYQGADVSLNINKHDWSDWETVDYPCVKDGLAKRTCSFCNKVETKVLPKTGVHFYRDWVVDKEPTCTEEGLKHKTCLGCGNIVTETLDALGHNLVHHEAKEPTCTEDGHSAYDVCSRCGCSIGYESFLALGHDEGTWVVVKNPTSIEEGLEERKCTKCGMVLETREISEIGHAFGEWIVDKEPTCTETGLRHKVCSECGIVVSKKIEALGHDLVHHDAKASTCTENGHGAYDTCSRCDYSTYEEISAHGHSYCEWIVDKEPSCTETGLRHKVCSECNDTVTEEIDALGHDYQTWGETPTCTENGYIVEICSRCGKQGESEVLPAKGHSYGEWIVDNEPTCTEEGTRHKSCLECGEVVMETINPLGHDFVHYDAKNPTCVESGCNAFVTCTRCGYSTYKEIPATGHSYGEWIVDKEPSCTETGLRHKVCSECSDTVTEKIGVLGHDEGAWIIVKNPACTEDGLEERRCTGCGEVLETRSIVANGHSYGDWVVDKNATCTETGTRHKTCSECGDVINETIDALGHDSVHHDAKAPTCTESGYDAYDTCTRCGYSTYHEISALGHDEGKWTVLRDSDCTHDGLEERRCIRCGELLESRTIDAKGHSYGDWIVDKEPTCTESGFRHKACSHCGDVVTETHDALGHDLVHHDAKAPTCMENGYEAYDTCTRCSYSTYKGILATGHSYGEWIVDKNPTCTETGSRHKTCSECGDMVTETLDALGHDYHSHREEATCTKDGYVVDICSRCGSERNKEIISAKGHSYGDWIVDKDPTCTETGTRHKVCSECDDVVTETLGALGHELVHHDAKDPTCTENGHEAYDTCSRCGYSTYHEIPALGHDEGTWVVVKNPTCTEDGLEEKRCTRCGKVFETRTITATGHSQGDWIVDKNPTCTETGTRHKVCSECDDVVTETLDALGHDLVHHDAKAPTCTESGHDAYDTCTRCAYSTYHEIPAKGHSYGDWVIVKEPTASSEGLKIRTCSICGDTETVVIPKLQKKNNVGVIAGGCVGGVAVLGCSILIPLLIKKKKKKSDK